MQIHVEPDGIEAMADDAETLAARQAALGPGLTSHLSGVGPDATGSPLLVAALGTLTHSWKKALHQLADDAHTLTTILRTVDEHYVRTEMRLSTSFAATGRD